MINKKRTYQIKKWGLSWLTAGLLLLSGVSGAAFQEIEPQVLFNRGNFKMEEQNYDQAIEIFRKIEHHGYVSGPLFYNIGISYVYLDSLGKATYYFHKSADFRETDKLAQKGLDFVEEQIQSRGTYIPYLPLYNFTDWLFFGINHYFWIVTGIVMLNIGVLLLLTGWLYHPNKWLVISGATIVVMGLMFLVTNTTLYLWSQNYSRAVVIESRIPLSSEPDNTIDDENVSDLAYEGYTVILDRRLSNKHRGMSHIRLQNGLSGWVPDSSIYIL